MALLLDLPPELLQQIISFLADEGPLSKRLLHEEPSNALLRSDYHPIKDLSQACGVMRDLCFPSLFSALKVDISDVDGFLRFSESHNLSNQAVSLLLYLDLNTQKESLSDFHIWLPMVRVIDSAMPSVVTALLPTLLLQDIVPYKLYLDDEWLYGIPCQVLQLRMPPDQAASSQTSPEALNSENIFQIREWTHCTFNQGSSINIYSIYEYFSRQIPSVFNPAFDPQLQSKMTERGFANLTSFDFIAIFPVDYMDRFNVCMGSMKKLKCLRIQFAPTPCNHVLDNPAAVGKCQPGDLWQEFEECYKSLADYIWISWYTGRMCLEEFISLDYANPNLRELLDRVMGAFSQRHGCFRPDSSGGRWIRTEGSPNGLEFSERFE